MAERYGDELADALPEVDLVAGFGVALGAAADAVAAGRRSAPGADRCPSFDLLELPRPPLRVLPGPT